MWAKLFSGAAQEVDEHPEVQQIVEGEKGHTAPRRLLVQLAPSRPDLYPGSPSIARAMPTHTAQLPYGWVEEFSRQGSRYSTIYQPQKLVSMVLTRQSLPSKPRPRIPGGSPLARKEKVSWRQPQTADAGGGFPAAANDVEMRQWGSVYLSEQHQRCVLEKQIQALSAHPVTPGLKLEDASSATIRRLWEAHRTQGRPAVQ